MQAQLFGWYILPLEPRPYFKLGILTNYKHIPPGDIASSRHFLQPTHLLP